MMMSNHSFLRSYFGRINIVEKLLCICLGDYETIDHVMWICERYASQRWQLWNNLRAAETAAWRTPVRDFLGCRDWRGHHECCSFLKRCNLEIYSTDTASGGSKLNWNIKSFARSPRKKNRYLEIFFRDFGSVFGTQVHKKSRRILCKKCKHKCWRFFQIIQKKPKMSPYVPD
jgi:hypothetical protein